MSSALKQPNQLVVGDEAGTLHLLEVPKNLVRQAPNERGLVDAFLRREQARIDSTTSWSRNTGTFLPSYRTSTNNFYRSEK